MRYSGFGFCWRHRREEIDEELLDGRSFLTSGCFEFIEKKTVGWADWKALEVQHETVARKGKNWFVYTESDQQSCCAVQTSGLNNFVETLILCQRNSSPSNAIAELRSSCRPSSLQSRSFLLPCWRIVIFLSTCTRAPADRVFIWLCCALIFRYIWWLS